MCMQQASISLRFCFTIIYYGGDTAIYTDRAATRVSANQLIFFFGGGVFCRRRNWPPSLFAPAFRNELQVRHINARINISSSHDAATSCTNFGPITPELTRVECGIFVVTRVQFDDPRSFSTLAFRNGLEYDNFDFSIFQHINQQ